MTDATNIPFDTAQKNRCDTSRAEEESHSSPLVRFFRSLSGHIEPLKPVESEHGANLTNPSDEH